MKTKAFSFLTQSLRTIRNITSNNFRYFREGVVERVVQVVVFVFVHDIFLTSEAIGIHYMAAVPVAVKNNLSTRQKSLSSIS